MKKEIKTVNKEKGIIQLTTIDERFYSFPSIDKETNLPIYEFLPSVTYITGFYPKGKFFEAWLKKMGEEAEVIKQLAGEKGSKVHQAVSLLLDGESISMEQALVNPENGQMEELKADEYEAICSFVIWYNKVKPKVISKDKVIMNKEVGYAGTLDLDCVIRGKPYIVDFKISKSIWPSYELQLSAYKHTPELEDRNLAILQLGYTRNKDKYKFTEVEDKFDLFLSTHKIFLNETGNKKPKQIELPLEVKL